MARNTYKQDEILEEPFDIRHLLRASSYIKKYQKRMIIAILLSSLGGAFGYITSPLILSALPSLSVFLIHLNNVIYQFHKLGYWHIG